MAKKNHMLFTHTELLLIYHDEKTRQGKPQKIKLRYNDLRSVSIKPCRERKGLKVVESERIIVRSPRLRHPIEYYKFRESAMFDDYKAGLRLFCKSNNVTIYDEVED